MGADREQLRQWFEREDVYQQYLKKKRLAEQMAAKGWRVTEKR